MNSLTTSSSNKIVFECSDIKNDIGLMVTSTTTKSNDDDDKCNNHFQLHLYDGYNDVALVMNIDIQDFANMLDALGPYFQMRSQIDRRVMNPKKITVTKSSGLVNVISFN